MGASLWLESRFRVPTLMIRVKCRVSARTKRVEILEIVLGPATGMT